MLRAAERLFSHDARLGRTDALLVVQHGGVVYERYDNGVDADTVMPSYSLSKSVLHAVVGLLVGEGGLALDRPAPVPAWDGATDPRHGITLRQLMTMRSGLEWDEDYLSPDSDVVEMLYGDDGGPLADVAAYAADKALVAAPGAEYLYSSGTANIVSSLVADLVGRGPDGEQWIRRRLLDPLGMTSATLEFDRAGTWIASSYCSCTARDYAAFGQLYLQDGVWGDERLLPEGWVDTARVETGRDDEGRVLSMHWFVVPDDPLGTFHCSGFLGQFIMVVPPLDLVVVRLGENDQVLRQHVVDELMALIGECRQGGVAS